MLNEGLGLLDIVIPSKDLVEVTLSNNNLGGNTLHVNIDGVCRLRVQTMKYAPTIELRDDRNL